MMRCFVRKRTIAKLLRKRVARLDRAFEMWKEARVMADGSERTFYLGGSEMVRLGD